MDGLGIKEAAFSHTCCVTLGKLNSLGFCFLVYEMRRLDHIISSKAPFFVPSSYKVCECGATEW